MSEWQEVRLGDVADEVTVGHVCPMASEYQPDGIPFLRSQNVVPHGFDLSDVKYIGRGFHDRLKKSVLVPGDVVTVRTGKPGATAVVPENWGEANCADLVIIRPGADLDSRWLSYYINSAVAGFVSSQLVVAVQQHFNVGAAKSIILLKPELAEQRAIAVLLGSLDSKIIANTELAKSADGLASLLFEKASLHAPTQSMSSVLTPILGGTPDRSDQRFWTGDCAWASARDVTGASFGVVLGTGEHISDMAIHTTKAKPLPAGSVILTARGTVGAVARLGVAASFNQSCYGFTADKLPPGVLYLSILFATEQAKAFAHGSVFSTITMRTFDHLAIPALDSNELHSVESRVRPLLGVVEQMMRENVSLSGTRDALLPLLMSGALRVSDAEKKVEAVV